MVGPNITSTITIVCLVVLLFVAVTVELRTKRIPNWLTLVGILSGIVLAAIDNQWPSHMNGLFLGLFFGIILFKSGLAAAGFVKLLIAVGTIVGPIVPLITIVLAALFALGHFIFKKTNVPTEQEDDQQTKSSGLLPGSVALSIISLIGMVYLFLPWS